MTSTQEKYVLKIQALLRKAESTTPEEAEALTEKAQELMARYAIEQHAINLEEGKPETVVEKRIEYTGKYAKVLQGIGSRVATAQGCRTLVAKGYGGPRGGKSESLYIIGLETDVDRALQLDASLQIQAAIAIRKWAKDGGIQEWMDWYTRVDSRRDFYLGFSNGVATRLGRAKTSAKENIMDEAAAAAAGVTPEEEARETVKTGMELAERTRKEKIDDWVDQKYGKLGSSRSSNYNSRGYGGYAAGTRAGANANTGSAGGLKQRKALSA